MVAPYGVAIWWVYGVAPITNVVHWRCFLSLPATVGSAVRRRGPAEFRAQRRTQKTQLRESWCEYDGQRSWKKHSRGESQLALHNHGTNMITVAVQEAGGGSVYGIVLGI